MRVGRDAVDRRDRRGDQPCLASDRRRRREREREAVREVAGRDVTSFPESQQQALAAEAERRYHWLGGAAAADGASTQEGCRGEGVTHHCPRQAESPAEWEGLRERARERESTNSTAEGTAASDRDTAAA
ncbi:hypothetical protein AGOR_G00213690 [Albula goreensis]|uniref:Uncharacterized protein n=1 Tax=Albula goreensis TaxID=1534307 RepID=A0A8T3CPT0_9TELE|nr:hypothetical protein AGOR_G00213690 [Albula goreensis]